MSGPIVRKYGFKNFEKIFGEKPIPHGKEGSESPALTPDLPKTGLPDSPTDPKSAGTMVPATEFGSSVE